MHWGEEDVVPIGGTAAASRRKHPVPYTIARRATQVVDWDDFSRTVETGDIALFSGKSLISELIKVAELGSSWSHIGT